MEYQGYQIEDYEMGHGKVVKELDGHFNDQQEAEAAIDILRIVDGDSAKAHQIFKIIYVLRRWDRDGS